MNAAVSPLLRALPWAAVLALAACVTTPPPTSELAAAQQSIARAVDADADQYAGDPLARARGLLGQAQTAMASGQNDQARQLAARASASADLATAHSRNAAALATLARRRDELAQLRQRLQQEPLP